MKWLKEFDANGAGIPSRVNLELFVRIYIANPGSKFQVALERPLVGTGTFYVSPQFDTKDEAVAEMERLLLDGSN